MTSTLTQELLDAQAKGSRMDWDFGDVASVLLGIMIFSMPCKIMTGMCPRYIELIKFYFVYCDRRQIASINDDYFPCKSSPQHTTAYFKYNYNAISVHFYKIPKIIKPLPFINCKKCVHYLFCQRALCTVSQVRGCVKREILRVAKRNVTFSRSPLKLVS